MKKLSLLWKLALASSIFLFSSCDTEEVDPAGPSFNFVGASSQSFSVKPSDTVTFSVVTAKGDKNMDKITFRIGGNPVLATRILVDGVALSTAGEYKIKASEDAGKTYVIKFVVSSSSTTETLVMAVIDNDGLTSGLSVPVTTSSYVVTDLGTSKLLGAQAAASGSYLSTTGVVTGQATATSASDIILSFAELGAAFDGTLISPKTSDRTEAGLTFGSDNSATTYFASSSLNYDTATGDDIANATIGTTKTVKVSLNGVYVFKQGNTKGLVKVTGLVDSNNGTGSVTISVKKITVASEAIFVAESAK